MKKLIVLLAISILSVSTSLAGSDPALFQEISQKVNMDLSTITLDQYQEDFVQVQFKIYDGLILIENIEASQSELKDLIIKELKDIHISTPYSESEVHNFNFTFEKK